MTQGNPPPYDALLDPTGPTTIKDKTVTLLQRDLIGLASGTRSDLLIPSTTRVLRTFRSSAGIVGIEAILAEEDDTSFLLGAKSDAWDDFQIAKDATLSHLTVSYTLHAITSITFSARQSVEICDTAQWEEAKGGHVGSSENWASIDGPIVGLVIESTHSSSSPGTLIGKIGVIVASLVQEGGGDDPTHRDLESHIPFDQLQDEKRRASRDLGRQGGLLQEDEKNRYEPLESQERRRDLGRFRYDTGRWTGNRGIGIRWNHETRRVEIYQGSNDPYQY